MPLSFFLRILQALRRNINIELVSVCPEMRIFEVCAYLFEIKDCEKNKHRHMFDIPSIIFFV